MPVGQRTRKGTGPCFPLLTPGGFSIAGRVGTFRVRPSIAGWTVERSIPSAWEPVYISPGKPFRKSSKSAFKVSRCKSIPDHLARRGAGPPSRRFVGNRRRHYNWGLKREPIFDQDSVKKDANTHPVRKSLERPRGPGRTGTAGADLYRPPSYP